MADIFDDIVNDITEESESDESTEVANDEDVEASHPEVDIERIYRELDELKEKMRAREERDEIDEVKSLIDKFYSEASDAEKELAEIYLEGVASVRQAEKAIDKIKARAEKLAATTSSMSPPIGSATPPEEDVFTKYRKGQITINDFLDTWTKIPGQKV